MADLHRQLCALLVLAGMSGCSHGTTPPRQPEPAVSHRSSTASNAKAAPVATAAALDVPPGHLPPPGMCRVWVQGHPPGKQSKARDCAGIDETAPAGSWVLLRPAKNRKIVKVRMVDERRAGIVVRVRVFDAANGSFLREERV